MTQSEQPRDNRSAGGVKSRFFKAMRKPLGERTLIFTLSLPKVLFGIFFSLCILVWAFIFGIMLGRGHNPEAIIPPLAKVMPTPAPSQPERPVQPEVIPSQDLKYHATLKAKPASEGTRSQATPAASPPAKPVPKPQSPTRQKQQETPQGRPKQAPPQAVQKKQAAPPPAKQAASTSQGTTRYNYSYQVAASNNGPSAEAMSRKLQGAGLAAQVIQSESKGSTWYRVVVAFTGTPEDTRTLRAKLAPFGISSIILRSKVPTR